MDKVTANKSHSVQSARPPRIQLWEIAERVLVMIETVDASQPSESGAAISASSSELAQMIAASPDLVERVARSSLSVCRPASEAVSSWAALVKGQCGPDTKRVLNGATLLLMKGICCDGAGWSEVEGLRQLGVARLMMPHPYREDGSVVSLSMRIASTWRERIDLMVLTRAAVDRSDIQAGADGTGIDVGRRAVFRSAGGRERDVGSIRALRRNAATSSASHDPRQYSALGRWSLFSLGKPCVFLINPCRPAEINLDGADKLFDATAA